MISNSVFNEKLPSFNILPENKNFNLRLNNRVEEEEANGQNR